MKQLIRGFVIAGMVAGWLAAVRLRRCLLIVPAMSLEIS